MLGGPCLEKLQEEERQVSGHTGVGTGHSPGSSLTRQAGDLHPVEQTAGIVPGWQRQPGSRNRTLRGVAKEHSQTGDTEMEPRDKILMARKGVPDATVEDPFSWPPFC